MVPRRDSYISAQLESINSRLQELFDDIGLPANEKKDREKKVFAVIEAALEEHVAKVKSERDELVYKCQETKEGLQSMINAIPDLAQSPDSRVQTAIRLAADSEVRPPYLEVASKLKSCHELVDTIFSQRLVRVNEVLEKLSVLSEKVDGLVVPSELMPARNADPQNLDLSNTHITELEAEVSRWQHEYESRLAEVKDLSQRIVNLWAELGSPQDEIDSTILSNYRTSPEKLGTKSRDVDDLRQRHDDLRREKDDRQSRLTRLRNDISNLWMKLNEDPQWTRQFESTHRGLANTVLEAHEAELDRLNDKKREHINVFIQDARQTLRDLWAKLYYSEDETMDFSPAWTDVYTDASLDAHEREIERLQGLVAERQPILGLIEDYYRLENEAQELENSAHDPSRLMSRGPGQRRDPTRLLREEQMRKRIAKRRPKVLEDLQRGLMNWQVSTGKPFLVNGEDFYRQLEPQLQRVLGNQRSRSLKRPGPASNPQATPQSTAAYNTNNTNTTSMPSNNPRPVRSVAGTRSRAVANPKQQHPSHLRSTSASAVRYYGGVSGGGSASPQRSAHSRTAGAGLRPGAVSASPSKANPLRGPLRAEPLRPVSPIKLSRNNNFNLGPPGPPSPGRPRPRSPYNQQPSPLRSPVKPGAMSTTRSDSTLSAYTSPHHRGKENLRVASVPVPTTPGGSENWQTYDDSSSDDEIVNSPYLRWREDAMKKLVTSQPRVSEFNWEKDVF